MSTLKKNLGYQTIYQILTTCLPLITSPYLARILGAERLGIFSYTQSIVNYFTLFAMLGLANYGTRTIASVSSDKKQRSKEFLSIFTLQLITSSLAVIGYVVYMLFACKANKLIAFIQIIAVISCFFDINWMFFGLEKFEFTVKRNIIIRVATVILILSLVKTKNDLWIYVLLMGLSTLLSQIVLWFYVPKYISFVKFDLEDVVKHIKPNIVLFLPLAAMSVYHIMDKTMLGMFSTFSESGFYYNSDKIINIPAGIISGISTVMMPRISALISKGKNDEMEILFKKSLEATIFISSALAFGIAAISNEFIPVFFGEGYEKCVILTIVLAAVLIIKGFSFTFRYQYLIPYGQDKKYIQSILYGMSVNLICNVLLIPSLGAMGAVIGTLTAETVACLVQLIYVAKAIDIKKSLIKCLSNIIIGAMMFLIVRGVAGFLDSNNIIKIIVCIVTGAIAYLGISYIFLDINKDKIKNIFQKNNRK